MNKVNQRNKSSTTKQYAPSIAFWQSKTNENTYTLFIDEKVLENVKKMEAGGRLLLSRVPEEYREENDRAPHYRLAIFSKAEVDSFQGGGTKKTPTRDTDDAGTGL